MINMELLRIEESEEGTLSVIRINGKYFCMGLEPPDKNNQSNISCIPKGAYKVVPIASPKFGATYMVADVPGRSSILFHAGNTKEDTHGCILLGETAGKLRGNRAVLNSGATFKRFLETLNGESATLTIQQV